MREDNLLCVRKRKFVVTTDSNHGKKVYPNLARQIVLTNVDRLWVADITDIRLERAFVYLAVVLDAFSRKVVGWALDNHLAASLALDLVPETVLRTFMEPPHASGRKAPRAIKLTPKDGPDVE